MIPDIPPIWVLKAARDALSRSHYEAYYDVLCGYYQIDFVSVTCNKDECLNLGKNVIAFYRHTSEAKQIIAKNKTLEEHTALHEFFHHLVNEKGITLASEAEQRLADAFAEACLNAV